MTVFGPSVLPVADDALGNTSYQIALDRESALVVDPPRDVNEHLAIAARLGVRIVGVLETHLHADFVGGAREIAAATGATVYAAADARLAFPFQPVTPGEILPFGDARVRALGTPGHTPEHVSYLLDAGGAGHVFTGGSLIAGGAARTDLSGADRTRELAREQFRSLRSLAALPGGTMLHPTHGAGSFCSTGPARGAPGTIADELASNPLLAVDGEDEFVDRVVSTFDFYPRYFDHLREINRRGAPLLQDLPVPPQIEAAKAHDSVAEGAWLIDARRVDAWAAAHPAGAISIELRPAFASILGWVVPFGAPVVLIIEPEGADQAIRMARRIGYDDVRGWLPFEEWRAAGLPVSSVDAAGPAEAARRVRDGAVLLDVRTEAEFRGGHLPGARHLSLGEIIGGATLGPAPVVVYCGHGERSATAASLLAGRGVRVANLAGGIRAWRAWETAGEPLR